MKYVWYLFISGTIFIDCPGKIL